MQVSFKEIISFSWQNTLAVLFRPYSLKKWILLLIIIILAGNFGGFNLNLDINTGPDTVQLDQARPVLDMLNKSVTYLKGNTVFITLAGITLLAFFLTILLWGFIRAVFQFVLIEALVKDDASIRIPFNRNRTLGLSFFYWNLIFGSAATLLVAGTLAFPAYHLFKAGIFSDPALLSSGRAISVIIPAIVVLVPILLLLFLVNTFSEDFVTVVMYTRGARVKKAWGIFLSLFRERKGNFFMYLLVKFLLALACLVAGIVILLACALALVLMLLAGGFVVSLIYSMTPPAARPVTTIVLAVTAAPLVIFIVLALGSFLVPIPVFLRFFAIYFLGRMDLALDAFPKEGLIPAAADEERYKKPLFPLWLAFGASLVTTMLLVGTLFYGGTRLAQAGILSSGSGDSYVSPDEPIMPSREPDVVYLKNGGVLKGLVVQNDQKTVTLQIMGGTFSVSKEDVKDIRYGKELPPE